MIYAGIDPGTEQTAWAVWDGSKFIGHGIAANPRLCDDLVCVMASADWREPGAGRIGIEQVCCYGRPVGREVFAAVWWSGIFQVRLSCQWPVGYCTKPQLCRYLLGKSGGTDAEIRAALIERFGLPGRSRKTPAGILWGIRKDEWLAAAYAVALADGIETSPSY